MLEILSQIAETQPKAAYTAFIFGYRQKCNYVLCTIPDVSTQLKPVEDFIQYKFLKALCETDYAMLTNAYLCTFNQVRGYGNNKSYRNM